MLRLLIDENFDHHILRGLKRRLPGLDYVLVRDIGLEGAPDVELLHWAAQSSRVILTHDIKTMVPDAIQLMKSGRQILGLIVVPQSLGIGAAINDLEIILECLSPAEVQDRITYVPL
jgi:hypothetical protein